MNRLYEEHRYCRHQTVMLHGRNTLQQSLVNIKI